MTTVDTEIRDGCSDRVSGEGAPDIVMLDPVASAAWHALVNSHSRANIFHHPAWLELLRTQYGFKIYALCLVRAGSIRAGIPFCELSGLPLRRPRLVCLPFSDSCGPLNSSLADLRSLLDGLRAYAARIGASVEIRDTLDCAGFNPGTPHWSHVTDLSCDPDMLFAALRPGVQGSIKKARKLGLCTAMRRDEEAMEIFYALHLMTRRRQGVPIQPRAYFTRLHAHIVRRGLGFVAITGDGNASMSGAVLCGFGKTLVYKYGASDPAYLDRAPNHLMLWDVMLDARQRGFSAFDFGKTDYSHEGLRAFKRGWHASETLKTYSHFPEAPAGGLFNVVNERLVSPLIRHTPSIVCRVAGELLYRHFGTR